MALGLLDILCPARVVADRIDAQPDDLGVAALELRQQPGHVAEFGGADRREILRVREQDRPSPDPVMETNRPSVVLASKSGAVSPICKDMPISLGLAVQSIFSRRTPCPVKPQSRPNLSPPRAPSIRGADQ